MDAQLKRLVLCAAFSPYSALLGRILREHAPDDTPLDRFRSWLPNKNRLPDRRLRHPEDLHGPLTALSGLGATGPLLSDDRPNATCRRRIESMRPGHCDRPLRRATRGRLQLPKPIDLPVAGAHHHGDRRSDPVAKGRTSKFCPIPKITIFPTFGLCATVDRE